MLFLLKVRVYPTKKSSKAARYLPSEARKSSQCEIFDLWDTYDFFHHKVSLSRRFWGEIKNSKFYRLGLIFVVLFYMGYADNDF